MLLFGNRVVADVIKEDEAPESNMSGDFWTQDTMSREDEAEVGMMILQAEQHQTVCKSPEARAEAGDTSFPHTFQRSQSSWHLEVRILTPELWEKKFLSFKPPAYGTSPSI